MKRNLIIIGVILVIAGVGAVLTLGKKDSSSVGQIKAPHFVDSTPLHGETYAAQPINVTVNFNFDLAPGSKISVSDNSGQESAEGDVLIEDTNTALKRQLKQGLANGAYKVSYTACWADKSCHDGNLTFMIDSSKQAAYQDLRGRPEITIDMKNIQFTSDKVLISPGTKVTWLNQDNVEHTVNSDTHPEHTYYPEQNSRLLSSGQTYAQTFTVPGQYNYHCTPHAATMHASLIVSN